MTKIIRRIIPVTIAAVALTGGIVGAGEGNDRVLGEDKYIEVFKREGRGDKNYLYTITSFEDEFGRECTVVSGDSEKTLALDCDRPQG
jgi:hypothetical protein